MHIIKHIIVLLLLLSSGIIYSQVTVSLDQPPPFQFRAENMWKVTLNNTGADVRVYLTGSVMKGNAQVIDATTSAFNLARGMKRVSAAEMSPIDLKKYNNDIEQTLSKTGTFESGTYTICIKVKDAGNNEELGSFCNDYEIINMTKMELISPENNDQVLFLLPSFTWLPPVPLPQGKTVSYQFQITEILNRQTPEYAFLSNPVYFHSEKLLTTLFQYPIAAIPLINGRKYAWRVITYIDNNKFIESPVWEFLYKGSNKDASEINKDIREQLKKDLSDNSSTVDFQASGRLGPLKTRQSLFNEKPFKFGISSKAEYEYNDKQAVNSELPRNFGSISVDPTVSIYGIPFNVNLFYDTRQKEFKQNINSFGFFFDPVILKNKIKEEIDKKKEELESKIKETVKSEINKRKKDIENKVNSTISPWLKIFSYFDNLGLGETYPNYTSNTVNGVKMTGADISFNPGIMHFAISGLNNMDAIPGTTFSRKMLAGSIGLGVKDKSHFHFNMMKAWDNENSIDMNTITNGVTPQDNIVFGTDAALSLIQDQLTIKAEANGSMLTRDKTAPDLVSEDIPEFVKKFLEPKISSQFDYMFEVSSDFKSKDIGTNAEISFKSVGPGYVSLGAPNIRQDIQSVKFKISQPFDNKKIMASVYYKLDKNNIAKLNPTTSTSTGLGFNLKINYKEFPFLIIDYRPNSVSNEASDGSPAFKNNSDVFSLTMGINQNTKQFSNSMNLIFSSYSSKSNTGLNDYGIMSFNGSNNITFLKIPLTISGSAGYTRNNAADSHNSFLFDLSAGYEFMKNWSNSIGASYYGEEKTNSKSSLYFNSSYSPGSFFNVNINLMKDFYREDLNQYGDFDNLIIRAGITAGF
ncbi:MAG: hypothetical protein JST15_09905 [Bacteroidetes bacterium]|nr:hypothetical protein [Bacteroidota bacterium]